MTNSQYCNLAKTISVSKDDTLQTKKEILANNQKYEKFCRP